MKALNIAATGMLAQQLNVEVISNNIANLSTTAYKRQRAEFQDLLYQNIERVGANSSDAGTFTPSGIQLGVGVKAGSVYRITEQGTLISTGNSFDIAINGRGFFRVQMPDGSDAFTRDGTFRLGPNGELVNADGFLMQPPITIQQEATDVTINRQGEVLVKIQGQVVPQNVGRLELTIFPNDAGLEAIGENLLLETPASGAPSLGSPDTSGFGILVQGFLESSNVNAVQEITGLITAQRAYEMNSRVISTADEMLNAVNQLR